MSNNTYEEYIKEFDNTGTKNISDLVRTGGVELVEDMLKNGFRIFYPYATHDDSGDEIDGVYLDEDTIKEQLKKISSHLKDKNRFIVNKWLEQNN